MNQRFALFSRNGVYYSEDRTSKPFTVSNQRFLQSDLKQLVNLGLLTLEYGSQGRPLFKLTRQAVRYLEVVDPGKNSSLNSSPDER